MGEARRRTHSVWRTPGVACLFAVVGLVGSIGCGGSALPTNPSPGPSVAPELLSIADDTLVAGASATLRGREFSAVVGENVVRVGGESAVVTAASDTLLVITVPAGACLPERTVAVTVAVGEQTSNELSVPLRPAETFTLAVGRQAILPGGSACMQLAAASSPEAYLVGIQRIAATPSLRTTVALTGVSSSTASHATFAATSVPPATNLSPSNPKLAPHTTNRGPMGGARQRSASVPPGAGPVPFAGHGLALVDSTVTPGDVVALRSVTPVSASCNDWTAIDAVVRHVGARAIWLEDTANAPGSFSDAQIQRLSDEFDDMIYETNTAWFGEPGDLDGNGRVVAVISRVVNEIDPGLGGFAVGCDLFPRSAVAGSNEGEYLWLGPADPTGAYGPTTSTEGTLAFLRRVVAHELVHVIQFTRRLGANGIVPMGDFLFEGQAVLGEEVVGHAFLDIASPSNLGYDVAFNDPPASSTTWYADKFADLSRWFGSTPSDTRVQSAPHDCGWLEGSPAPCPSGRPLFYAVTWSLLRWIGDHLAPGLGGEQAVHRALIDTPSSGFALIEDVTGMPTDSMFAQWAAALYLDDRFEGLDTRLTIPSWNFADVFEGPSQPKTTAGLAPAQLPFGDFAVQARIASSSTAYFRIEGEAREALSLAVTAPGGGNLPTAMQVFVVRIE